MKVNTMKKTLKYSVALGFMMLILVACSTQKAKWANIQYHNTTCHYNVWWNGNESLNTGINKLRTTAVDDYTSFIMPENLGTESDARSINPDMDRAIEKGVKGIKKHSIYVKGEEHVPYIKECYLLTAYATFYKRDYPSTVNTCNILVSQFAGTRACDEASVLLARCATMERRYADAEMILDQLVGNFAKGNFSKSVRGKLYNAMVEATVPQGKYKKAVEYIHQAIDANSDSRTRARLTFLMAQIYQKLDKRVVAAKYYHEVLRYGPEYVMEFNARLGEASCADFSHSDIGKLERQLDAMLDDKKNEEYRDQIYFAKGEMYLGMKDAQRACENYRLSVALATQNKAQRARSALRMGEVQYEVYENYDVAQRYYDTAMQCITPDYPQYDAIRRRHNLLTELTSFTRVYERQDSLLAVATMPVAERNALINSKIEELKKQEEEAKERALLEELKNESKAQMNTLKGDWYFYNSQTVQRGKETFRQRWGVRTLEDYWFLSNKTMLSFGNMLAGVSSFDDDEEADSGEDEEETTDSTEAKSVKPGGDPNDPHSPAYYMKDLPTTQAQFDSIDSLIAPALLGAAYLYYDGVNNTPRALECYLRLAEHYTTYSGIEQALYMLYRIFDRQGNTPQANYYRDMVLMGFPDGDYANMIRDNEYYKELQRRDRQIDEDYEEVYTHYGKRHYSRVLSLVAQADEMYPGNPALHRFHYWKGLALAGQGERVEAVKHFNQMLSTVSKGDSIVPLVEAQLALLESEGRLTAEEQADENITERDEKRAAQKSVASAQSGLENDKDELPPDAQVFRYREGQQYYVVLLVNERTVKATELQYTISDFNTQYYSNSGYKVNASLFNDTTQLITVHRFMTEQEAMGYYRHLLQEDSPLKRYQETDCQPVIISTQNYATFYNRRNPAAYILFFKKYYLKQ